MPSFRLIEHLDLVEYFGFSILSDYKYLFPDTFTLQGFKEAFHNVIIITASPSTHAGNEKNIAPSPLPSVSSQLSLYGVIHNFYIPYPNTSNSLPNKSVPIFYACLK